METLAREAWLGVDLLNVTVNRSHGRVIASDFGAIHDWALSHPGFRQTDVPLNEILGPVQRTGPDLPACK